MGTEVLSDYTFVELVQAYVDWLPAAVAGVNGRATMGNDAQVSWYTEGLPPAKCLYTKH